MSIQDCITLFVFSLKKCVIKACQFRTIWGPNAKCRRGQCHEPRPTQQKVKKWGYLLYETKSRPMTPREQLEK